MLNREKLEVEIKKIDKSTPKYKTCIGIVEKMKGYQVRGNEVYFYLGGEKNMGKVTYPDVNEMMLKAIGSGDIPEMNEKCVSVEKGEKNV